MRGSLICTCFFFDDPDPGDNSRKVELDIWLPSLKLAFEYQGKEGPVPRTNQVGQHHYHDYEAMFGPVGDLSSIETRDKQKQKMYRTINDELTRCRCSEAAITLVHVPYWWDESLSSLSDLVYDLCPELQIFK
jgi:hypothetical protein